ncbi:MAG TPA: hypothetical protein VKA94_14740, partial [Hyphomicrobiales bacterium]|nr:hypothetical protein [Hyphomicrobiales bacterium]
MARAPARKPSRPSRRRADPDQLSFFDPAGALLSLQREERELRTQKSHHEDHRRFLTKALERATDHEGRVAERQALPFRIEIRSGGSFQQFRSKAHDGDGQEARVRAGEALLKELQARHNDLHAQDMAMGLGTLAGLEMCAVVVAEREDGEPVLEPLLRDTLRDGETVTSQP